MSVDAHFVPPLDTLFFDDLMIQYPANPTYCHDTYTGKGVPSYSGRRGETVGDEGGDDTVMVRKTVVRRRGQQMFRWMRGRM